MIEEILPALFRITIPLPEHPLQTMNSYVVVSKDRSLLIDTGWNHLACAEALFDALEAIGVILERIDVLLTHVHADHAGLIGLFKNKGAKIFCGAEDLACIDHYLHLNKQEEWTVLQNLAKGHGFFLVQIEEAITAYPGNYYAPDYLGEFNAVQDNRKISVGEYSFSCIATPGHTPGHLCLYEPEQKLLISGDHILGEFSPTISQWTLEGSYLVQYLASLDKIAKYAVKVVLPGHGDTFTNYLDRIAIAKAYRKERSEQILALFENNVLTAYQVASLLPWNEQQNAWMFFSIVKKWGAVGDTVAQLCYLRDQGKLKMKISQEQVMWCK